MAVVQFRPRRDSLHAHGLMMICLPPRARRCRTFNISRTTAPLGEVIDPYMCWKFWQRALAPCLEPNPSASNLRFECSELRLKQTSSTRLHDLDAEFDKLAARFEN